MNEPQFRETLKEACARFGNVRRVVNDERMALEDRTKRLEQWQRTWLDVEPDTARLCFDAIHRGDFAAELKYPDDWADKFPSLVRRWCKSNRAPELSQRAQYADPKRVRCVACRDTGFVSVVNASFVAAHRSQLERGVASDNERDTPIGVLDPKNRGRFADQCARLYAWYRRARKWCRTHGAGPFVATAVCDCDHHIAKAKREAIREGRLSMGVYSENRQPVMDGGGALAAWEACAAFVADYAEMDAYEWNPA